MLSLQAHFHRQGDFVIVSDKELPELDDEFAKDVSEFDTLAEYKESLKKDLEKKKQDEAKRTKEDEAIQKIIDKSKMEIPEAMIDTQCETMIEEFAHGNNPCCPHLACSLMFRLQQPY